MFSTIGLCRQIFRAPGLKHVRPAPLGDGEWRRFFTGPTSQQKWRYLGQPTPESHPHLMKSGEVTPGIKADEFMRRRSDLMREIARHGAKADADRHLVIIPGNSKLYMTTDVPYPFRQNTNFLYMSGFLEPDSVLVLETDDASTLPQHKSILFVPKRDPGRELWDGARTGAEDAVTFTRVDEARNIEEFPEFLSGIKDEKRLNIWYDHNAPTYTEQHEDIMSFVQTRGPRDVCRTISPLVQEQRLVKSASEIELLRESARIGCEAFVECWKRTKPGVDESLLYARFDYESRARGAECLAYIPVVAGGDRANTLHYISNNNVVKDGELLLMDAGCEYHGYTCDITRTWPVNGRFTRAQQEIYEVVLKVQETCINACYPGCSLDQLLVLMNQSLGIKLQQLMVVPRSLHGVELAKAVNRYCPHHVGHYMGMDIHDTVDIPRNRPLTSGTVITVEPGVYIPRDDPSVPEKYCGIGVRIEDNVLLTDAGPVVLTEALPKQISDIENIVGS